MKKLILRLIFFVGWILSPFTFWNDAFVNIPISYICANIFVKVYPANFLIAVLVFYWLSNGVGIIMMYLSGKQLVMDRGGVRRELIKLLITIVIYSIILVLLDRTGILKPLHI